MLRRIGSAVLDVLYPPRDPETGRWLNRPDWQQFAVLAAVALAIGCWLLIAARW